MLQRLITENRKIQLEGHKDRGNRAITDTEAA